MTAITNRDPLLYEQCMQVNEKIKEVIKKYKIEDQVIHITNFLSQQELSERLWISDLGYLWGDGSINASSASIKEFISARLPAVVTNSQRYMHDKVLGIIKTNEKLESFAEEIFNLLKDSKKLYVLRNQLEKEYKHLNYNYIFNLHLKVFNNCLKKE